MNKNGKKTFKKLWDVLKALFMVKYIALNAHIKKNPQNVSNQ